MKKIMLFLIFSVFLIGSASAEIIFQDNFDYSLWGYPYWYQNWSLGSDRGIFPYLSESDCVFPSCVEFGTQKGFFTPPVEGWSILELRKVINTTDYKNVTLRYMRKISFANERNKFKVYLCSKELCSRIENINGLYLDDKYKNISMNLPINDSIRISFYTYLTYNDSKVMFDNFLITGDPLIEDSDNDGIPDDEDKCPDTTGDQISYGCDCNQILELKPGKDEGLECTKGIINVFKNKIGWAKNLW